MHSANDGVTPGPAVVFRICGESQRRALQVGVKLYTKSDETKSFSSRVFSDRDRRGSG